MKIVICLQNDNAQYPEQINVWTEILRYQMIGALFINQNVTGEIYLEYWKMLQTL